MQRASVAATALAIGLGTVWICDEAHAQDDDLQLSVTDTLTFEYRTNNKNGRDDDDDFGLVLNRLNVIGSSGALSTQVRVDSVYFPDETLFFPEPPLTTFRDDARLERLQVRYALGDFTLTAGDFYRQLGRGIALSLRKVDEAGLDVALRGGQLDWSNEPFEISIFAGLTNPANLDTVNQTFIEDVNDIVVAGNLEFDGIDGLTLGLFGMYLQPTERLLDEFRDQSILNGLYANMPGLTDWLSIYVELGSQRRQLAGRVETGRGAGRLLLANALAAYTAIDMAFPEVGPGDLSFLIEAMALDDYEVKGSRNTALGSRFDYNFAPTLERIDQEIIDNTDVRGVRLRAEYFFLDPELLLFVNPMFRINSQGEPEEVNMLHVYAGAELTYQDGDSRLGPQVGYREETRQGESTPFKTIRHVDLDWVQYIADGYSLHFTTNTEFRFLESTNADSTSEDFVRGSTYLGMEKSRIGSATVEFGYDTQNPSPEVRNLFFAGIVTAHLGEHFNTRVTAGTQRGGIKCIGGVCREWPAFSGVRLELVGQF